MAMREIIFDTETTGFDPFAGDRMVEIGCIEMIDRMATGRTFHAYFNPERDMPEAAERIHGLSVAFLSDKPRFSERAADLLAFIGDSPLVAHNATFDFRFLNFELAGCGHPEVCMTRMIDTFAIAQKRHPGAKHSLDALCTRYGIDRSHRTKHGALLDAELLAQVYIELHGGRQIGLELVGAPVSADRPTTIQIKRERPFRSPRPHAPSDAERAAHAEFMAAVASPLWGATP